MGALMDYTLIDTQYTAKIAELLSMVNPGKVAVVIEVDDGGSIDAITSALTGVDVDEIDYDDLSDDVQDKMDDIENAGAATLLFQNLKDAREFLGKVGEPKFAAFNGTAIDL